MTHALSVFTEPARNAARTLEEGAALLRPGLALISADRPDEAAHCALGAVMSGRLVPSNYWRAAEVITALRERHVPEATELEAAYREVCETPERSRDNEG
jgi:hypothetical protein